MLVSQATRIHELNKQADISARFFEQYGHPMSDLRWNQEMEYLRHAT
jgi:hypothetical protein